MATRQQTVMSSRIDPVGFPGLLRRPRNDSGRYRHGSLVLSFDMILSDLTNARCIAPCALAGLDPAMAVRGHPWVNGSVA